MTAPLRPGDLKRLGPYVKEYLGAYWLFQVFTKKQCEKLGTMDPPCAYAEVTLAGGTITITIDADGEWHIDPIGASGQMPDPKELSGRFWLTVVHWRDALTDQPDGR
jgi:hypothetical protein